MAADTGENVSKGNTYSWLGGEQTGVAAMELSVEIPQKDENTAIIRSSHITLRHITKVLYTLLQRYLLIHINCYSILVAINWKQLRCSRTIVQL